MVSVAITNWLARGTKWAFHTTFCFKTKAPISSRYDRWRSPGTGCPGRLWSLLLWRYSRPAWTRSCAACCRWPCFGRRVGLDDPQRSLSTLNILWFCDSPNTTCQQGSALIGFTHPERVGASHRAERKHSAAKTFQQRTTRIADCYLPFHKQGKRNKAAEEIFWNARMFYISVWHKGRKSREQSNWLRSLPDLRVSSETAPSLPSQNESHCSVANVCLFEITVNIMLNSALLPHASLWLSQQFIIGIFCFPSRCLLLQYAPTQETGDQEQL